MNWDMFLWIFGAACGCIASAVVFSFKLGGLVAANKAAMELLTSATGRLNELIAEMRKDQKDHEKDNQVQINALWKSQDALRERIVILENEVKTLRRDVELLASR